jgi:DNA primase
MVDKGAERGIMSIISREIIEEIRAGNDLLDVLSPHVALKRIGNNYKGLCPFHKEKTPSFHVYADDQRYHCFGCGAGGNVFGFVMQMENLVFPEAVRFLADRIRYTIPEGAKSDDAKRIARQRERLYDINKEAARFYYDILANPDNVNQGGAAARYLDGRGVSAAMRKKFGLGWAPGGYDTLNRHLLAKGYEQNEIILAGLAKAADNKVRDNFYTQVMFPIFNARGNVVGFGGGFIDGRQPKYINSRATDIFDKSRTLYGINFARLAKSSEIILVEGYMDVIAMVQAGFRNVCAALGTSFNNNHAKELKNYCKGVILLFDNDKAGEDAVLRALPVLASNGIRAKVLTLPEIGGTRTKDPDDFIKAHGAAALNSAFAGAVDAVTYKLNNEKARHPDLNDTEAKISFVNSAAGFISEVSNAVEREIHIENVAKTAGVAADAVKEEVRKRIDKNMETPMDRPHRNRRAVNGGAGGKGADEARRGLLRIMAEKIEYRARIAEHMTAEEFHVGAYIKIFNVIKDEPAARILPASIISYGEDTEEQNIISNVFNLELLAAEDKLTDNINDWIGTVKEAYIDLLISAETDINSVIKLGEKRRSAKKQYITG